MNDSTATEMRSSETAEIREAMVRLAPSGGVRKPISQVITVKMPNSTGSIPSDVTSGRKTAVNRTICARPLHEGADEDVENADQQQNEDRIRGDRGDPGLYGSRHVIECRQLSECERGRQQDQNTGQKCGEAKRFEQLFQGKFAVDEQTNEEGVEDRNASRFGGREDAAIDAAQYQHRVRRWTIFLPIAPPETDAM